MPLDPVSASVINASVKSGFASLKAGIAAIRRRFGKRKADKITSSVITELLKASPDVAAVEAQLAEIEAAGMRPTVELHRAKQMFGCVRGGKAKAKLAAAKKRWAQVGARKKTSSKKVSKTRRARAYRKLSARKRRPR
jgi:hypothetical protein